MSKIWYPFTAMAHWASSPQLRIESAKGNYLHATNGQKYLDGVASLWTNVHGHNHPHLNQAITGQLAKVAHSTLLGLSNPLAEALSERLTEIAPGGLSHVFFSDSGSTAVEIALKQAFQYWQILGKTEKTRFVHLEQAYHGDTLGAVAVGGIDVFHQVFGPLLIATDRIPCPNGYWQSDFDTVTQKEAETASLRALEELLQQSASTIAALIIEPLVQGAGGILTHSPEYLRAVAEHCHEYDVLLIADEVATGFGRTGRMFAVEHAGVEPDFLCLAKGITGGYLPLAATLSTDRIYEAFLAPRAEGKTFFHGHTYTGNALGCAAALANLEIFENEQTMAKLPEKIAHLDNRLAKLAEHRNVGDVRQQGLMVGVELVEHRPEGSPFPPEDFMGDRVCQEIRNHGVILRNLSDVVVLMPPLSITIDEIDTMTAALETSIGTVCP